MSVNTHPEVLLYPRIRKSPFFYASRRHGVAMYSVYNRTYHARHYGDPVGEYHVPEARAEVLHDDQPARPPRAQQLAGRAHRPRIVRAVLAGADRLELLDVVGHYGDPVAEYWALLNGVTLWDVGVERQVEITGPDAFAFTNLLVTRDLTKCQVGQCKYVFLTDTDGGILNDPVLLRLGENHFWLSLADSDILLWARGVAYRSGYDVQIREVDVAPVQVQGPLSIAVMRDLFGDAVLDIGYYYLHEFTLDGSEVIVSRTGYTAEIGYEIYVRDASRNAMDVWDRIVAAGRPHGLQVIGPCHIRRIEGGILAHGCDITFETNPYEVGMGYDWMVSLDQEADFIGKEALVAQGADAPRAVLCTLTVDDHTSASGSGPKVRAASSPGWR